MDGGRWTVDGRAIFFCKKNIMTFLRRFIFKYNKISRSENELIVHSRSLVAIFAIVLYVSMWSACEVINPPEAIPSYIQIDTVLLATNQAQGSASSRIEAVQVIVENELLGIFPLPTTVPVLQSGLLEIKVDPVIIESGISSLRELYPFYERYTTMGELVEGEILTVLPQTSYNSQANFVFIENFDGGNSFVDDIDGDVGTRMEIAFDAGNVFEGSGSGKIVLNEDGSQAVVGTGLFYQIPISGRNIFLEMNYKCNNIFTVGIRGRNSTTGSVLSADKLTIAPRDEWNKVYISLDEEASSLNADEFQIYIKMTKSIDVPIAEVFLDNIKLIYN